MRSRPLLFVGHARFWRLRRALRSLRPHRAGVLAPLAVAVVLAAVGNQVSAPSAVAAGALAAPAAAGAPASDPAVVGSAATRQSVARTQPAARTTRPGRAARAATRTAVDRPDWVRPSRGALTSFYGMRWGRMHRGIDFGASYGSPIYAAADGVVTFAGSESGYGRLVTIRHGDGWVTAYGHMSRIAVSSGRRVTAGQVIAYVGSEGRSTGPHLHFEVRTSGGGFVNPLPFLRARGVRV